MQNIIKMVNAKITSQYYVICIYASTLPIFEYLVFLHTNKNDPLPKVLNVLALVNILNITKITNSIFSLWMVVQDFKLKYGYIPPFCYYGLLKSIYSLKVKAPSQVVTDRLFSIQVIAKCK